MAHVEATAHCGIDSGRFKGLAIGHPMGVAADLVHVTACHACPGERRISSCCGRLPWAPVTLKKPQGGYDKVTMAADIHALVQQISEVSQTSSRQPGTARAAGTGAGTASKTRNDVPRGQLYVIFHVYRLQHASHREKIHGIEGGMVRKGDRARTFPRFPCFVFTIGDKEFGQSRPRWLVRGDNA